MPIVSIVGDTTSDRNPNRLIRRLFDHAPDALMVVDDRDRIVLINTRAEQFFGYTSHELVGQSPRKLLPAWFESLSNANNDNPTDGFENVSNLQAVRKNGEEFCAEVSLSTILISDHKFIVAGFRDTTPNSLARHELEAINKELEKCNKHLSSLSKTDPLTELLNRRGLEHVLQREISYARRNNADLLAVLVDLDDFKSINDDNGHATGDRVLRQVSQTLQESLRTVDWIGRVGGDEFLILLPSTPLSIGAQVAERVRLALSLSAIDEVEGQTYITASMGLVSLPNTISSIEEVLELTTAALHESKIQGKNRVTFGDDCIKALNAEARVLSALLDGSNDCRVITQPILMLEDEAVIGHELLTRGPQGPLEKPDDLFRVSLRNDILTSVDLHCLKLCLKYASTMPDNLTKIIHVFASTLIDKPTRKLIELIKSAGIEGRICLEFSESKLMTNSASLKEQVRELRGAGIAICLDDIGFGGSTLESLILLEPEFVKINSQSIVGVARDADLRRILGKLAKLARSIGVKTIADGIENRDDFAVVKEMGVDFGQGSLWGS